MALLKLSSPTRVIGFNFDLYAVCGCIYIDCSDNMFYGKCEWIIKGRKIICQYSYQL